MKSVFLTITILAGAVSLFSQELAITGLIDEDSFDINEVNAGYDHFENDANYELIADRLACLDSEMPLTFNTRVLAFINYFASKDREYTARVLARQELYFPLFEAKLHEHGIPEDLKYLSIIESGLVPKAISRVGASGLWQFMPATGRAFKLHQDWYIDERYDPEEATEAASKYLKSLYKMFGDWELALAAYNTGPGNVRKAIRRSGYKKTFWDIYPYLPRETRSYLPQFVAITYVMRYADEYNFLIDEPQFSMETDTIMTKQFVNLKLLAKELNFCYEDLEKINPAIKRFAKPQTESAFSIRIPTDLKPLFNENRNDILAKAGASGKSKLAALAKNSPGSTYGRDRIIYKVRSGDVLGTIAQRYKVRVSDLKKWNNLSSNMIRVGQRLNIWTNGKGPNQAVSKAKPSPKVAAPLPNSGDLYVVLPGDTLWDISRKFQNLSIEKIMTLNNLKSNSIQPGQKLKVR